MATAFAFCVAIVPNPDVLMVTLALPFAESSAVVMVMFVPGMKLTICRVPTATPLFCTPTSCCTLFAVGFSAHVTSSMRRHHSILCQQ
jgi:hypothetical protein